MQDDPSAQQLVEAVKSFIETVAMPNLEGHAAFHARVAANALGIVARELDLAPTGETHERQRLSKITGAPVATPVLEHNRMLSKQIREERIDLDDPVLIDHLRRTTLVKLQIDQPTYSGLKTATTSWAKGLSD